MKQRICEGLKELAIKFECGRNKYLGINQELYGIIRESGIAYNIAMFNEKMSELVIAIARILSDNQYWPDYVVCPGETLQEEMEEHGMTIEEVASLAGMSTGDIEEILSGDLPITPSIASSLESVTGIPARLWLNLEDLYRGYSI